MRVEVIIADDGYDEPHITVFINGEKVGRQDCIVWNTDPGQDRETLEQFAQPQLSPNAYAQIISDYESFGGE